MHLRTTRMERREELETLVERAKIAVMNAQEYLRVIEDNNLESERPRAEKALYESLNQLSDLLHQLSEFGLDESPTILQD